MVIVQSSQNCWFPGPKFNLSRDWAAPRSLASLRPFINHCDVICIGGRLLHSDLSDAEIHPMLLSKDSYLSLLVARHWHTVTCHTGPRVITSLIMRQCWIMSVRSVIRKIIGQCTTCVRAITHIPSPIMGSLPSSRVKVSRPFSKVGVDYAGPLPMSECRWRKFGQYKIYVAIFVCMATKSVHLEIVTKLSTEASLAVFDRDVGFRRMYIPIVAPTSRVLRSTYPTSLTIQQIITSYLPILYAPGILIPPGHLILGAFGKQRYARLKH